MLYLPLYLLFHVHNAYYDYLLLQAQLEVRKASRIEMLRRSGLKPSETEDIMDEEEFKLMKDLREAKRSYKNRYEQLQKYKGSLSQANASLDLVKVELASAYSNWGPGSTNQNYGRGQDSPTFGGTFDGEEHSLRTILHC